MVIVDARSLVLPHTGVGRYALGLLQHVPDLSSWRGVAKPGSVVDAGDLRWVARGRDVVDVLWNETTLHRELRGASAYFATNGQVPWRRTRATVVSVVHDLVHRDPSLAVPRGLRLSRDNAVRASVARADVLVTTTDHVSELLRTEHGRAADLVLPSGPTLAPLDHADLALLDEQLASYPEVDSWVLAVGPEVLRKNYGRLAEAVRGIPRTGLAVVGGPSDAAVAAQLLGLQDAPVLRCGFVSDTRLASWYARAACLAYPSLAEGYGLPLREARRCGLSLVTSDLSPMRDESGAHGVVVDPLDVTSLRRGLERALALGRLPAEELGTWSDSSLRLASALGAA